MHLNLHWARFMRRLRWMSHPITVFVSLQVVWLAITIIWVIWFVGEQAQIALLAQRFGTEYFNSGSAIAILIVGCVLLGVLLVGTIMLFVFGQRQSAAARQQRNFVSSVTHELKSPLASLQLGFETIATRQLEPETRERLMGMVYSDIERLRRLVDQILVAGHLERGVPMFDEERLDVDAADLVSKVSGALAYLDEKAATRIVLDIPPNFSLKASKAGLTLILHNLIENAFKYSPRGTPITVAFSRADDYVVIEVKDQGLGLDKRDKRRIFKMFHRSESAIKKAIPGTGLGLFIVKSAVAMLGGRVWADSAGRNQGSSFFVRFPEVGKAADAVAEKTRRRNISREGSEAHHS